MATKRRRIGARRLKDAAQMPAGVRWWVCHGRPLTIAEAHEMGMCDSDAWAASNLAYDRPIVTGWRRRDLRELGYGLQIDQHIASKRCAPDRDRR